MMGHFLSENQQIYTGGNFPQEYISSIKKIVKNWSHNQFFLASFPNPGVFNEDTIVRLDGARPPQNMFART